jgi:hypothetical protein
MVLASKSLSCWTLTLAGLVLGSAVAQPQEFQSLFNGKDLQGWVVEGAKQLKDGRSIWSVQDGRIVADAGRDGYGFLRYDRQPFGDFTLRVEYRMTPPSASTPRGNSGIGIRTGVFDPSKSAATRPSYAAYEIQLLDDAGKPPSAHGSGSLYRYAAPSANPVKAAPEWNAVEIECVGPRIRVTMNGQKVLDVDQTTLADLPEKDKPKTAPAPKDKPLKGHVCLQSHTGRVEFRTVEIREIK